VDIAKLEISDSPNILNYYKRSLKHFRQVDCCKILKAFIKFIKL
jgi:hypothetical protein